MGSFKLFQGTGYHVSDPTPVATSTNGSPGWGGGGAAADRTDERGHSVPHFQGRTYKSSSLSTAVHFNTLPCGEGIGTWEFRPVINLKALNRFLPKEKVQNGGSPYRSLSLLCEGDYMMKLDLKDVYYAVPIHQE